MKIYLDVGLYYFMCNLTYLESYIQKITLSNMSGYISKLAPNIVCPKVVSYLLRLSLAFSTTSSWYWLLLSIFDFNPKLWSSIFILSLS
jgi:hypothetical protein